MRRRHPANNGKVLMSAWVDAPLRDYVRAWASDAGVPVSDWIAEACRRRGSEDAARDVMGVIAAPLAIDGKEHAAAVKHARAALKGDGR